MVAPGSVLGPQSSFDVTARRCSVRTMPVQSQASCVYNQRLD